MNSTLRTPSRAFVAAAAIALGLHSATFAADPGGSGISPDAGLADRSRILKDDVKAGKLKIVSAFYDLDTGRVTLLK